MGVIKCEDCLNTDPHCPSCRPKIEEPEIVKPKKLRPRSRISELVRTKPVIHTLPFPQTGDDGQALTECFKLCVEFRLMFKYIPDDRGLEPGDNGNGEGYTLTIERRNFYKADKALEWLKELLEGHN